MCKHYLCLQETDRHYIDAPHQNNCVLCLAENEGPMTQSQVAKYIGVCKMRISQIERRALDRLRKKMAGLLD